MALATRPRKALILVSDGGDNASRSTLDEVLMRTGDPITLSTSDRVFRYRVSETKIVNPQDLYVLDPTERPAVTRVTCYPFEFIGHAPRCFIVRADLVSEEARLEASGPGRPGQPVR